jgi:hypothetical protein
MPVLGIGKIVSTWQESLAFNVFTVLKSLNLRHAGAAQFSTRRLELPQRVIYEEEDVSFDEQMTCDLLSDYPHR